MSAAWLRASRLDWLRKERWAKARHTVAVSANNFARVKKWGERLRECRAMVTKRDRQLAAVSPLRLRAFKVAEGLIGVMESGGDNRGVMVTKIIRANGGTGPEPWCGDFCAYCYRLAGSTAVRREWAAVRLMSRVAGVRRRSTSPLRGDLVRFTFDHVGMFDRDNGDGTITTIEGNTGASGAVSDGDGGDGVYRKRRAKGLVSDYLAVTR